jgi:hypothetical protein
MVRSKSDRRYVGQVECGGMGVHESSLWPTELYTPGLPPKKRVHIGTSHGRYGGGLVKEGRHPFNNVLRERRILSTILRQRSLWSCRDAGAADGGSGRGAFRRPSALACHSVGNLASSPRRAPGAGAVCPSTKDPMSECDSVAAERTTWLRQYARDQSTEPSLGSLSLAVKGESSTKALQMGA